MKAKISLWCPTVFFARVKAAGLCGLLLPFKTQRQKKANLFPITQNNCERMPYGSENSGQRHQGFREQRTGEKKYTIIAQTVP